MTVLQRPETLVKAVARHIRESITRGEFAPGQALPEARLAETLQISRSTIREALRVLADQGLVDLFPHRGAEVAKLTPRRAWEIFSLRAELESFAVRLVMERGGYPPEVVAALREALEALTPSLRGDECDQLELAEADMRFHDILSRQSEHRVLLDTLSSLRLQTRRFIVHTKLMGSDKEPEYVTHRRLIDAVTSGDPVGAAAAVHRHIMEAGENLMVKLRSSDAAAG